MRTMGNGRRSRIAPTVDFVPSPTGVVPDVPVPVAGVGAIVASGEPVVPGTGSCDRPGLGEGSGLGDGLGSGSGDGLGLGLGDGVGSGGGAAVTMAVGCDCPSSEPRSFVTRTRTRSAKPTSSPVTVRWLDVAPGTAVHCPFDLAQRSHCQDTVGSGSPVQVAVAVSVCPSRASPEITGLVTVGGPGAARPRAGTTSMASGSASNTATTSLERLRRRIPTIRTDLGSRRNIERPSLLAQWSGRSVPGRLRLCYLRAASEHRTYELR